ncbi:hypothetical protein FRX31_019092, partial [Thalictrum thalictroides]
TIKKLTVKRAFSLQSKNDISTMDKNVVSSEYLRFKERGCYCDVQANVSE